MIFSESYAPIIDNPSVFDIYLPKLSITISLICSRVIPIVALTK